MQELDDDLVLPDWQLDLAGFGPLEQLETLCGFIEPSQT
jgi:hypothetical protein